MKRLASPRRFIVGGSVLLVGAALLACKKAPPLSSEGARIFAVGERAATRGLVAASFGTCAQRKDGIWCWGSIGDGEVHARPARLPLDAGVEIVLGGNHYCVVGKDRRVACAGRNLDGELGDGTFANRTSLAPVRGLSNVVQIAAGSYKTCAVVEVRAGGADASAGSAKHEVHCFGTDEGQGKNGTPARRPEPARVADIDDAREVAVEWGLACVRRADGSVWCWGNDDYEQLGNGTTPFGKRVAPPTSVPVRVLHVGDAVGISAGGFSACVLTARGTVGCWGENSYGGLGDGTTRMRGYASAVVGLGDVAQVAMGGYAHTCARRRGGDVWCWGYRIGLTRTIGDAQKTPVRVEGIDDATEIASGHTHTCARRKNGSVVCWGDNSEGQLGDGTKTPTLVPREVLGPE